MTEPAKTPKYPVGTRLIHKASGRVAIVVWEILHDDGYRYYCIEADINSCESNTEESQIELRYDVAPKGVAP